MSQGLNLRKSQVAYQKERVLVFAREKMLKPAAIAAGVLCLLFCSATVHADEYETRVVVSGLNRPTGIVAKGSSTLFITQLPTPGVNGANGGRNTVDMVRLDSGRITNLTTGEPEPTNLTLDKHGNLYWTCKSAGVILERSKMGKVSLFLGGLSQPSGISADKWDNIYFTQLPTPGLGGGNGGRNTVNVSNGVGIRTLTIGEPEPTDIVVSKDGDAYWTCKSAGVILKRSSCGTVRLLLGNLKKPTGITIDRQGYNLYFTEVPNPGVSGQNGGMNRVSRLNLATGRLCIVNTGDPEPTDIAIGANGDLYWTCTSAGVIVEATPAR